MSRITRLYLLIGFVSIVTANFSSASFDETLERYPNQLATLTILRNSVPYLPEDSLPRCLVLDKLSATLLGGLDPVSRKASDYKPPALYFNFFENCAREVITAGFSKLELSEKNSLALLGQELSKTLSSHFRRDSQGVWSTINIKTVEHRLQIQLVQALVRAISGSPEVLHHFKLVGEKTYFNRPFLSDAELSDYLAAEFISSAPEAEISLLELYSQLFCFLNLGPLLRS